MQLKSFDSYIKATCPYTLAPNLSKIAVLLTASFQISQELSQDNSLQQSELIPSG